MGRNLLARSRCLTLDGSLRLESGKSISGVQIAYETYGRLNSQKSNAILVFHALSGDAHAAGSGSGDGKKPGWWDYLIGPGKGIDTEKYFVICANTLGGCMGTTGPQSVNPSTGKPYGLKFPIITIGDMVRVHKKLLDHLGIGKLLCIIGGSMGGMEVLKFISDYPDSARLAIPIAVSLKQSPQAIAFHEVGRQAVMRDPNWKGGGYYGRKRPDHGLSVARMLSHITYMSEKSLWEKFGRNLQNKSSLDYHFDIEFQVESYLNYQGQSFTRRFDANSYLYITRAIDYFDVARGKRSAEEAFRKTTARCLVISISSDWLYPTKESLAIVSALRANGIDTSFIEVDAPHGHDSFLIRNEKFPRVIGGFIDSYYREAGLK